MAHRSAALLEDRRFLIEQRGPVEAGYGVVLPKQFRVIVHVAHRGSVIASDYIADH